MRPENRIETDRRTVITSIATVAASTLAGCNDDSGGPGDTATADDGGAGEPSGDYPEEFADAKADVETAYERLASLPIVVDGEFAFDVYAFEDEFDHEAVRDLARDARERLETIDATEPSESTIESLITAAELAELLTDQRRILHQTIVAAFAYEHHLFEGEYDPAIEAIRDARSYLSDLSSKGERIEETLEEWERSEPSFEGFDTESVRETQTVLVEITRWTDPAHEGLHRAIDGFRRFEDVTEALERDRFGTAGDAIGKARARFAAAEDAFDRAHGRGRRLHYVTSLVDAIRCMMPAYREGCDNLREAFEAYDDGEEARGEELAREAIDEMEEAMAPCP